VKTGIDFNASEKMRRAVVWLKLGPAVHDGSPSSSIPSLIGWLGAPDLMISSPAKVLPVFICFTTLLSPINVSGGIEVMEVTAPTAPKTIARPKNSEEPL